MCLSFHDLARTLSLSVAPAVALTTVLGCGSSNNPKSNPFETDMSVSKFAVATAPSYVNTKGDRFVFNRSARTYQWSGLIQVDGIASPAASDPLPNVGLAACRVVEQGSASFTDRRYATGSTLFLDLRPAGVRVEGPIEIQDRWDSNPSSIEPGGVGYQRFSTFCLERFERNRQRELTNLGVHEISPARLALKRSISPYLALVEDTYFGMSDVETLDVSAAAWPHLVGRAAGSLQRWQTDLAVAPVDGFIGARNWTQTIEFTFNQRAGTILIEMKGRTENLPLCLTSAIYQVKRIRLLSSEERSLFAQRVTRRVSPSFAIEVTEISEQINSRESAQCAQAGLHRPWQLVNRLEPTGDQVIHLGLTHYSIELFATRLDRESLRLTREAL